MKQVILFGANGKMGQIVSKLLATDELFEVVAGVDQTPTKHANPFPVTKHPNELEVKGDLIIDFSHPTYLNALLEYALHHKIPAVIATTGYSKDQMIQIKQAANQIPILYASNMSLGVNLIQRILKQYSKVFSEHFDIEIIEKHHNKKLDAPSGTALTLVQTINESLKEPYELIYGRHGEQIRKPQEIGMHSIRGGTLAGEHTVLFSGIDEMIEIKHTALSKDIFALGAIKSAKFLIQQNSGFYTIENIFK